MPRFSLSQIGGVIPATLSPFASDESMDINRMRKLTSHLLEQKVHGLYLTGSTGEGFMMSEEERKAQVESVIDEVRGRVPVIVHVGAISTQASERLARHAANAGADAISSVPPIYWHFTNDSVAGYYEDLVQASGLPMIVYNIALAGLVSYDMLIRLGRIQGVEGMKYTSTTHFDFFRIKEELGENFRIFSGSDEMALSGLNFGAHGLIGSTYNLLADRFVSLFDAFVAGDSKTAQQAQENANRLIFAILKFDLIPALKVLMKTELDLDVGVSRRPFSQYGASEIERIVQCYREAEATLVN